MPWNESSRFHCGIRSICRKKILDLFHSHLNGDEWKLLVIDEFAMKIITLCFKTEDILSCNIALIERLEDNRESLPYLSAIYLARPTDDNIKIMINDFDKKCPKYKFAHLIFLSTIPENLFNEICENFPCELLISLQEIDIDFIPYETQVFSLHMPLFFKEYFNAYDEAHLKLCEVIATKLVTLFSTIGEIPLIRYRRGFVKNIILAETIWKTFENCKSQMKHIPDSKRKPGGRCQLLVVDRGFDCVSPLLHEFTLQAMAHDLLDIKDDVYEYALGIGHTEMEVQSVALHDEDPLWQKVRHEHIANVARILQGLIEADEYVKRAEQVGAKRRGLPSLGDAMKDHLAYKQNEAFYSYRHMANDCMKIYCGGVNILTQLEQDLATRHDEDQKTIRQPHTAVMGVLSNSSYTVLQKVRLLLLYIFFYKGITKANLMDIIKTSQLPLSSACPIMNVLHLDIDVLRPGYCIPVDLHIPWKDDEGSATFKQSRWVPAFKSLILSCLDGTLSTDRYPFLNWPDKTPPPTSNRTGYWCVDKRDENASRLVVFVAGGITHSEMRSAYEVIRTHSKWDIVVGSDSIITPSDFIEKLNQLHCFVSHDT